MMVIFIAAAFITGFLLGRAYKKSEKKAFKKAKRKGEIISLSGFLNFDGSEPKTK